MTLTKNDSTNYMNLDLKTLIEKEKDTKRQKINDKFNEK